MKPIFTLFAQAVGDAAEAAKPAVEEAATQAAEAAPQAAEAVETAAAAATPWYQEMLQSGALGYMIDGGIFMWPILFLGILAAGVIIERFRSLKMLSTDSEALRTQVLNLLNGDRVEEALELCEGQQGPVPAILSVGLRKFLVLKRLNYDAGKIEEQVVKSMDDYGVHIVAALEKHLPILATVSSAAPMLGFLGTVQGMVISFEDIVARMGEVNIVVAAADGIKVALLTTVLGLIVGIPAFVAYNYFTGVINRFVLDVEETSTELIEAVTLQMAMRQQESQVESAL
jgi:biopolymer transport protein ExbB